MGRRLYAIVGGPVVSFEMVGVLPQVALKVGEDVGGDMVGLIVGGANGVFVGRVVTKTGAWVGMTGEAEDSIDGILVGCPMGVFVGSLLVLGVGYFVLIPGSEEGADVKLTLH